MENLILDSANIDEIKNAIEYYPILGVTTNPTLLSKSVKDKDVFNHLARIKKIINPNQQLHIQVTHRLSEDMVEQALAIVDAFGENTFVKIPSSKEGLKAMKFLKGKVNITATLLYTPLQGIMAAMAGAKYLAFYYNRMESLSIDTETTFKCITSFIERTNCNCDILAASFKNSNQVINAYKYGANYSTVPYNILEQVMNNPIIKEAEDEFLNNWKDNKLDENWM